MADNNVKDAGKQVGSAFKNFGKTLLRSAKTAAGKMSDMADGVERENTEPTVFSDGSWKKVGKDLASSVLNLGEAVLDKVDDAVNGEEK